MHKHDGNCPIAGRAFVTWAVVFEPAAHLEIADAFTWYEDKSYGLGGDFLRVVAAATEQLSRNPEAFASSRGRFRRVLLRRFPYALHFEILSVDTGSTQGRR